MIMSYRNCTYLKQNWHRIGVIGFFAQVLRTVGRH
jgi:hypothetical protein